MGVIGVCSSHPLSMICVSSSYHVSVIGVISSHPVSVICVSSSHPVSVIGVACMAGRRKLSRLVSNSVLQTLTLFLRRILVICNMLLERFFLV